MGMRPSFEHSEHCFRLRDIRMSRLKVRGELDDFTSVKLIDPGPIANIYASVVLKLCAAAHESTFNGGKVIGIQ
jgi:hypothetical protein